MTTTVLSQVDQMLINFNDKEITFNFEKTWETGIYKIKSTQRDQWRYMKLYTDKGVLHIIWYKVSDGRSIDKDFRLKKEA